MAARRVTAFASVDELGAQLADATKAREAAEAAYDVDDSPANLNAVQAAAVREASAKRLFAEADTRATAQKAEAAAAQHERDTVKLRTSAKAIFPQAVEQDVKPHLDAIVEHAFGIAAARDAILAAVETQRLDRRAVLAEAKRLGVEVTDPGEMHHGNARGLISRALGAEARRRGVRLDVHEWIVPEMLALLERGGRAT